MERTMLETFCAAANIKTFVEQEACPIALRQLRPIVEPLLKSDIRGTLMSQVLSGHNAATTDTHEYDHKKYRPLDLRYYDALRTQQTVIKIDLPDWTAGLRGVLYEHCVFRGLSYSKFLPDKAGGIIFFRPNDNEELVPGVIRDILGVAAKGDSPSGIVEHKLLVVQRLLPCPPSTFDPFHEYPDFGARIWSRHPSPIIEIVPAVREFHHAIVQSWNDEAYVMKSTATVSYRCAHSEPLTMPYRTFIGLLSWATSTADSLSPCFAQLVSTALAELRLLMYYIARLQRIRLPRNVVDRKEEVESGGAPLRRRV